MSCAFAMPRPHPVSFKSALSESDVVELLRQSLRDWDPRERAQLPDTCRIEIIRDGAHVNEIAFKITTARIESRGPQEVLERLDTLFAYACQRLTELGA